MAERWEEDRAALALAGREAVNLDFIDGQYRPGVQPLEPLVAAIEAAAPEGPLLAPSNIAGDHPDHGLVRAAALALRERGREVSLYADLPHATRNGVPDWSRRLRRSGGSRGPRARPRGASGESARPSPPTRASSRRWSGCSSSASTPSACATRSSGRSPEG